MKTDYDSPWKEAISRHFQDFLQFFFPEIHDDIDWERGHRFLDSELRAVSREAKHGRRHVDALVEVTRLGGTSQLILIHVEIQSQRDAYFGARMLLYNTRIADRFKQTVCSLAILADSSGRWRPSGHRSGIWGSQLKLKFPMRKLVDYPAWAQGTKNPFAWLTAAHLQARATRKQLLKRAEIKFRLVRGLYECGLTGPQIRELFWLVDWILALPEPLEYTFRQELARYEKENSMPHITSFERVGRKKGRQEGLKKGLKEGLKSGQERSCQTVREAILKQHQQRWGEPDLATQADLQDINDLSRLLELLTQLMVAGSCEEWKHGFSAG
ncbi:MAG: transposase [Candidatus Eremiobacteraeota bacterium]|nr:transposase [Candidatus Eremiobacteraeota bacterium]MCW5868569.1 transposase [Candidatus Eremiobacteraeota bacterium]